MGILMSTIDHILFYDLAPHFFTPYIEYDQCSWSSILLLLNLVRLNAASSSKKFNPPTAQGSRNYLAGQSLVRYRN